MYLLLTVIFITIERKWRMNEVFVQIIFIEILIIYKLFTAHARDSIITNSILGLENCKNMHIMIL